MKKKALAILVCLPLLVLSSDAKRKNETVLLPQAQGDQERLNAADKHGESALLVRELNNAFNISAGMIAGDADTVRLVLKVINASGKPRVFAPDEIVVILPNGNSYRPFSRVDVLAQAYEIKADPEGRETLPTHALSEASYRTSCSVEGDSAACPTTPDVSMQAWYARRSALGAMIRSALQHRKFKKYVQEVKVKYLASQEITPGNTITGYVDLYVEDVHNGPFTVRVPAGDTRWIAPAPGKLAIPKTTYDFRFDAELVVVPE